MPERLTVRVLAREQQHSDFDWMNIDRGNTRVGRIRASINGNSLTIYSINIFPKFEGRGYAREIIDIFKTDFDTIIADRVRPTAIGFWSKMGFHVDRHGSYVWKGGR
jgi:ribosomal protein S18 acetylase RimI-like enzyme